MSNLSIAQIFTIWQKKIDKIDIELLLAHVLHKERTFILAHPEYTLTKKEQQKVLTLLRKREKFMPIAYITGEKEFYGRVFYITKDTLVPRSETETFITLITQRPQHNMNNQLIIDIGTGSGIIPITLACEIFPKLYNAQKPQIIATDISKRALSVAKKNAHTHKVQNHILFLCSDLLRNTRIRSNISQTNVHRIIITANLPYVDYAQKEIILAQKISRDLIHEPSIALWAGDHGLFYYKKLIRQILFLKKKYPKKEFTLLCEIVPDQVKLLQNYMALLNIRNNCITITQDLAKKDRIYEINI